MTQYYLKLNSPERSRIGGVGEFGAALQALVVSESIANQFDNDACRAVGWVVTRIDEDPGVPEENKKKGK